MACLPLVLLALLIHPLAATAFEFSPTQLDQVAEHAGRGGIINNPTQMPCGTVCDDLWLSEHRPLPDQPPSRALHNELGQLRQRTGLLPRLATIGSKVSLAATAGIVGWKIGEAGRSLWWGVDAPPQYPGTGQVPAIDSMVWKPAGHVITDYPCDTGPGCNTVFTLPGDGWRAAVDGAVFSVEVIHWSDGFGTLNPCKRVDGAGIPEVDGWSIAEGHVTHRDTSCDFNSGVEEYQYVAPWHPQIHRPSTGTGLVGGPEDYVDQPHQGAAVTSWTSPSKPISTEQARTRVAAELEGKPEDYPILIDWYAHEFDPENEDDPLLVPIPDCTGLSYTACVTAIQAAGFGVVTVQKRSFLDAEPMPLGQPQEVFGTSPAAGVKTAHDTEVLIDANPDDADMPRLVPAPLAREDRLAYGTRLEALGLVPSYSELDATLGDPARGPQEAVSTLPDPGTRLHKDDGVDVRHNPPDWPSPDASGGSNCDTPDIRPFALGPLSVPLGDTFPFGLFGWLIGVMTAWLVTPEAPHWVLPLAGDIEWTIDFAFLEPLMVIIRPCLLVVSVLGVVWMLAASAMRIRGDGE